MFAYQEAHPANLYGCSGIPQTHAGWEMQLLVDGGLLFMLYARALAALEQPESCERMCMSLCRDFDRSADELLQMSRAHHSDHIATFVAQARRPPPGFDELIIATYLRLGASSPGAVFTLDLFPAHTGPENVRAGLAGLLTQRGARKFHCRRAETYVRYYGINVAKALGGPRLGLVVPFANGVQHITLTRCWPVDGAENAARMIAAFDSARGAWLEAGGDREGTSPRLLICGYSQGGAAVRLLADAMLGVDVLAREHFSQAVPRAYLPRARALRRWIEGRVDRGDDPTPIHTVSVATMGGLDGVGLCDRLSEWPTLAEDRRGAAGVRSRVNGQGGVHLAICHDLDPARWVVPGPVDKLAGCLLQFAGPNLVFHGGTWTADSERAFSAVPEAMVLIEDVQRTMLSPRFVDEGRYFDPRCARAAFPHLVVGTYGYPGWKVVEAFVAALGILECSEAVPAGTALTHEASWAYDILPPEHDYAATVAEAQRFHRTQRRRARGLLAGLGTDNPARAALEAALREHCLEPLARRPLLSRRSATSVRAQEQER
ncbi:MAG: hypothetical protein KC431_15970 [Myxococcales bacterium]|nr:hypothetical protein [Myxococcales bacterium]